MTDTTDAHETTGDHSETRRRFLTAATSVVGVGGVAGVAVPFLGSWNPSEKAKAAGAPVRADIGGIEPGQMVVIEWRGKPVYVLRRTAEQVADLVARHDAIERVRVTVGHDGSADTMAVAIETTADDPAIFDAPVRDILKLRGDISLCPPGSLPRDGIVIEDTRDLN